MISPLKTGVHERQVTVLSDGHRLEGTLVVPPAARGVVLFAHGSGSGRFSPRNQYVASVLQDAGLATLLLDLLEEEEDFSVIGQASSVAEAMARIPALQPDIAVLDIPGADPKAPGERRRIGATCCRSRAPRRRAIYRHPYCARCRAPGCPPVARSCCSTRGSSRPTS